MKIKTHKPNPTLWLIAFLFFVYALVSPFLPFPSFSSAAMIFSAGLLLLGTTII